MLCTFCPPTFLGDCYRIPEKSTKSSANKTHRACKSKDQTLHILILLWFCTCLRLLAFTRIRLRFGSPFRKPDICLCLPSFAFASVCLRSFAFVNLAGKFEILPCRAAPCRDSIAEGISHLFLLRLIWCHASIAEIPSCTDGIATQVWTIGGGVSHPISSNWDTQNGQQHPSPNVKNLLRLRTANLARSYHVTW